jgi:CSLREA domain-containing protein
MGVHRWRSIPVLILVTLTLSGCTGLGMIVARLRGLCETPIFVVTATADTSDGQCTTSDCSLRDAVQMSNACPGTQTISIPAGIYTLTRLGTGEDLLARWGDLDITDSVQIEGEGNPILDGNRTDRVFDVLAGTTVDMTGLTIQHGQSEDGGGILNRGNLRLHNMTLQENTATSPVDPTTGPTGGGGGILTKREGTLTMEGSRVIGNSAYQGGGIAAYPSGESAALHPVEILDTVIAGNSAETDGGGLYLYASLVATLRNVEIRDNNASRSGGGLWNQATLNLEEVLIQGNHAGTNGGGIYNNWTGRLTAYNLLIENGLARFGGGVYNKGVARVQQSAIVNNQVEGGEGGGVFNADADADLIIENSTISGNEGEGLVNTGRMGTYYTTVANNTSVGVKTNGPSTISNSILADNMGGDCDGGVVLAVFNIESTDTCGFWDPSNLVNTDPLLMPLGLYGGTTPIHALNLDSPAVDVAGPGCPDADQRGMARPIGLGCDIGAYELQPPFDLSPAATPIPGLGPTPPLLPTLRLPTPTNPPEPISALLGTFVQNGNCRGGPGGVYGIVTSYTQGTQVTLEGRSADNAWWWVLMPGGGGHCFASGSVLELSGPTASLPIIAAPPTPTTAPTATTGVQPPAAPGKLSITNQVCTSQAYSVTLGWNDAASNETGYRIYRNGNLIATLGANAGSYTDSPPYGGPYEYGVEAFNAAGASGRPTVVESGCIT